MSFFAFDFGKQFSGIRRFTVATAAIRCIALLTLPAAAFAGELATGDAVVTHFSGAITAPGSTTPEIDVNGFVASAVSLNNPGFVADGRQLQAEVNKLQVTAGDVGQVFGIALDDASPANIYLAATAAFGLHRNTSGNDWMAGMWGRGGGPGTIYRLNAQNGYKPEVFADVTLKSRSNSGASLGNIAFDATNRQLLVSDLETGMIHRFSIEDGSELGVFDHGTQARTGFFDVTREIWRETDPVEFNPATSAQLGKCDKPGIAGKDTSGAQNPACWNLADFRRRIWGLGVHKDKQSGETRIYYGIWGTWHPNSNELAGAGDDARNAVWSVALGEAGAFQTETARREFILPEFSPDPENSGDLGVDGPVADIAFTEDGRMLLGERGGLRNLGLGKPEAFAAPYRSRVLQYIKTDSGIWAPGNRIDVGFDDRSERGAPYIRANAGGGVDFGFGFAGDGTLDTGNEDASIISTGDGLCSVTGACFDPDAQAQTDIRRVDGIQVSPSEEVREVSPGDAAEPYPDDRSTTSADLPSRSYMINVNPAVSTVPGDRSTQTGDVEIYRQAGPTAVAAGVALPERTKITGHPAPTTTALVETPKLVKAEAVAAPLPAKAPTADKPVSATTEAVDTPEPAKAEAAALHAKTPPPDKPVPATTKAVDTSEPAKAEAALLPAKTTSPDRPAPSTTAAVDTPKPAKSEAAALPAKTSPPDKPVPATTEAVDTPEPAKAGAAPLPAETPTADKPATATPARIDEPKPVKTASVTTLPVPKIRPAAPPKEDHTPKADVTPPARIAHLKWKSKFHRKWKSHQHNKATSRPVRRHIKWKSKFHRKWKSHQHNKATSRPVRRHIKWKSKFHRKWKSQQHNKATSRPMRRHIKWKSKFHRKWKSSQHNKATSESFRGHIKWKSWFHRKWKSSQHNKSTSRPFRARSVHRKQESRQHRSPNNHSRRLRRQSNDGWYHNSSRSNMRKQSPARY